MLGACCEHSPGSTCCLSWSSFFRRGCCHSAFDGYSATPPRKRHRTCAFRSYEPCRSRAFLFGVGAIVVAVPILVEPTFRNVVALVAAVGLALAFALKDYVSSLVAGLATVLENSYQPGDWIEVGGIYGEVKSIALRAVRIVTPDDNEVSIPHSLLWSASISNASSGNRSLLCVAEFYLHPDHDAAAARRRLAEVAETSSYWKAESTVSVIVLEKPWGTQYRLKAYAKESRDQFLFITDLTIRGKEALRTMGIRFAQAPYAETKRS